MSIPILDLNLLPEIKRGRLARETAETPLSWNVPKTGSYVKRLYSQVNNRRYSVIFTVQALLFMNKRGSLGNDDHDGGENITKKIILRPFKLYRVYLEPFNSSYVGNFSRSWILKGFIHVQIEKGKFVVVCPRSP